MTALSPSSSCGCAERSKPIRRARSSSSPSAARGISSCPQWSRCTEPPPAGRRRLDPMGGSAALHWSLASLSGEPVKQLLYDIDATLITGVLFVLMLIVIEAGYRFGIRHKD